MTTMEIINKNIKQYIKNTKGAILWLGAEGYEENFYVVKRVFTARGIEDQEMRTVLNDNVETSEYLPSYKYAVVDALYYKDRKFSASFKTKTDAVKWIYDYFKSKERKDDNQ